MDQELNPEAHQPLIASHSGSCLFRTTLCCLSNKKDSIKVGKSPFTPIHFIL